MDFIGIVISVIIVVIALILGIVGIILLLATSTGGKYKYELPSLMIAIITVVFCAVFLKFAHDGLLNGWLIGFMVLLIVLNPLLASIGAYKTRRNLIENFAGIIFLLVTIGLLLFA